MKIFSSRWHPRTDVFHAVTKYSSIYYANQEDLTHSSIQVVKQSYMTRILNLNTAGF